MSARRRPASLPRLLVACLLLAGSGAQAQGVGATHYADRSDAMALADEIAARRDLDPTWVRRVIGQAAFLSQVPRLMLPPTRGTAKNWRAYRARFIDAARIRAGVRFWRRNHEALARAQAEFGVPPEIIVGIIGVETIYGENTGKYRVLDALATLSFDFPAAHPRAEARRAFFQRELEHFLTLVDHSGTDALQPRGSYAGAMGLPQFMPSSWRRYAVDFDGDGRIDLWGSEADAIGSVAHYFQAHGWQPDMPTHYAVRLGPEADLPALLEPDIRPSFEPAQFEALGGLLEPAGQAHQGPLALIELQNGDPAEPGNEASYVAGTGNFYAITRYNWSSYYAMAVIELGRAVATAMGR
ncbi:MAG TPA: lytic murein transglycosylase B [Ottowia sp.]|uniref:lytic murein transglycosylase B n=1 Tax=Ottowia sp. TaxID=1898956 RepID=UPI002BE9C427|nr:lytic murein transglycosylase B [Ottowia sp.]HMN21138.1 lytic murein transglycosylase B [Ottowia sp.]